jgi:hypothetical protein
LLEDIGHARETRKEILILLRTRAGTRLDPDA